MAAGMLIPGMLAAINAMTYLAFRHDKRQAIAGGRRVAEARLLWLALIGGTPAAFAARHLLRHKTRKQPFGALLWLIAALQGAAIAMLANF